MSCIAIITARGGSKRIPKKNIREFCGKPIIAYSIEAALKSEIFDEVMVSTDSFEIADIAKKYGASVPFMRSLETSNDYATTNDVLEEVLKTYSKKGIFFDVMACIYPTAPFITSTSLISAYEKICGGIDSVMTTVKYGFPPQRGLIEIDGKMVYREKMYKLTRSQDLQPIYHDAGQFYFYRVFDKVKFIDDDYSAIILPETEVQDIDNLVDWQLAELKFKMLREREK